MKSFNQRLLMLTVVLLGACNIIQAQTGNEIAAAQRIKISVADNQSVYSTVDESNHYVNLLQLSQPDGQYQLTAGMLNEGDNHIIFHRIDDHGIDTVFARVNLNAEFEFPESKYIGAINFYGDGTNTPSSDVTLSNADLPDNWGTNGSGLVWQTSGYGTITSTSGLTFTVPAGYSNATMQLIIYVGSNVRGGYFCYNYNNEGWRVSSAVTAGGAYVIKTFTGVNSGDVISIYGGEQSGSSYYLAQSPDIRIIGFVNIPKSIIPVVTVTPTVSYKDGENWGAETALGSGTTYTVNDTIDLYGLGAIEDVFYAETDENAHSAYYNYSAEFNANIVLPVSGSTVTDFTATVDFTAATTTSPTSAAFTGPGYWEFMGTNVYTPTAGTSCYIVYYGSMLYTLPDDFMGNSVNVTVTTANSDDGTGDVVVNGISHTFISGETFTWSIPVTANGAIEFKSDGTTFSPDITQIVISSNGAKQNTTDKGKTVNNAKLVQAKFQGVDLPLPIAENKYEASSKMIVK